MAIILLRHILRPPLIDKPSLGRVLRKNLSRNQEAWLYTFAAPKLVEFANRIAEEIPDIPVVFRQSIETDAVSKGRTSPLSIQSKDHVPTVMSELKLKRTHLDEQKSSHLVQVLSLEHSGFAASLSFELLGGFREKVVSTFSSPF